MKRPLSVGDRVKHRRTGEKGRIVTIKLPGYATILVEWDHGGLSWWSDAYLTRLVPKRQRLEFWVVVGKDNKVVTFCVDESDARLLAKNSDKYFVLSAPHRIARFVEAKEKK